MDRSFQSRPGCKTALKIGGGGKPEEPPQEVCALAPQREFRKAKEWTRRPWEVAEASGSPGSLAGGSKALTSAVPSQK